ncbi:MAG: hypothetical protein JRI25_25270, partial [Deltaproteobacteria bacterium]|nr:hypothetical protein [Deltaproteobacteria bacterium]
TYAPDTTDCDDGDSCTGSDECQAGQCVSTELCCGDSIDNDGDGLEDCDDLDCAGTPGCDGTCAVVPVPDPVADTPLDGENPPGTFELVNAGGFTDDYVYNSVHSFKIGTRRQWGGTIIFYGQDNGSPGMNNTNTIDANDTGREVQVAFYDPDRHMQNCAWNASCQSTSSTCPFSITYLGWNPVQGGNRCNNGSGTENVDTTDGAITITTVPLFWNPNWDRQDCSDVACNDPSLNTRVSDVRVIQSLRFVREHVVELDYTVINLATLDHAATAQEFPTVYTANGQVGPDLWRLFDSAGAEITIDTPGNDGFFYENFNSAAGWVTMQNDALTYGVGMYTENRLTGWQGWQLRSLPFNNFRPVFSFGIPSMGTIRARSYLLLGSHTTVTSEAQWLDQNLAPVGVLDAPAADANLTVNTTVNVHGWALDNKGVTGIELIIDGDTTNPIAVNYGDNRPDVCLVWPNYPDCNTVGYSGSFSTAGLTECPHLLEVNAHDTDGNQRIIARRRIYVTP